MNNLESMIAKNLNGKELLAITRAIDMLCIEFGKVTKKNEEYGARAFPHGEIALHVQTFWRVRDLEKNIILFSQSDIYRPYADVDLEEYNWDSFGANQFDHISKQWENQIKGTKVLCCDVSPLLDIFIELENHQVIEVYSDSSSRDSELWRLFEHGASQHLVARDSGLQVE